MTITNDRMALLARLALEFNSSLDPDEVLKRVMDDVINLTKAERGFVMLIEDILEEEADQEITAILPGLRLSTSRGIDNATVVSHEFHVSRSVIQQVLTRGEPLLTSDAQSDERFTGRQSIIMLKLRSILCVPLKTKERTLGVIYVDSRVQAGIFTSADTELLTIIAANAAIAIENGRLYRETQRRLETLNLLHKISTEITATLDLKRVLTMCTEAVQKLLGGDAASILTIEGSELVFQVAVGDYADSIKPFHIPLGKGVAGWVASNCQPIIVNDLYNDARFYRDADSISGFRSKSLAAAPLIVNGDSIGVVEVFNKPGGFHQTDIDLLATFASSAAFAIENARLYQVAVEKGRMERELQVARSVQASLLPAKTPELPGWELSASWQPARQVAGDYYDFISRLGELHNSLGIVIGDVTDKGMPAALFMAFTRSTLRASVSTITSPTDAISQANILVSADSYKSMFVTLFYGSLDPVSGMLTYVNAGHNPPYILKPGNPPTLTKLTRTGIPLGIDASMSYNQAQIYLEPADMLICYTDGATDALNPEKEDFGIQRLENLILQNQCLSAKGMVQTIETALQNFIGAGEPFDDITLVVVQRLPVS